MAYDGLKVVLALIEEIHKAHEAAISFKADCDDLVDRVKAFEDALSRDPDFHGVDQDVDKFFQSLGDVLKDVNQFLKTRRFQTHCEWLRFCFFHQQIVNELHGLKRRLDERRDDHMWKTNQEINRNSKEILELVKNLEEARKASPDREAQSLPDKAELEQRHAAEVAELEKRLEEKSAMNQKLLETLRNTSQMREEEGARGEEKEAIVVERDEDQLTEDRKPHAANGRSDDKINFEESKVRTTSLTGQTSDACAPQDPLSPVSVAQIDDEHRDSSSSPTTRVLEGSRTAAEPKLEVTEMRAELDSAKSRLQDMDQVQKDLEAANKRLQQLESLVQALQRNADTNPTQEEAPGDTLTFADFRTSCAPTILQYTTKGNSTGAQDYLWSTEGQLVVHTNDKEVVATNVVGEVALLLGQATEMNLKPSALFQLWMNSLIPEKYQRFESDEVTGVASMRVMVYFLSGETRTGFEVILTKNWRKASSFEAVLQAAALLEQLATWKSAMLSSTSPITTHEHRVQAAVDADEELGDEDPFEWSVVVEHFADSAFYSIFAQCLTFGEPGLIAAMLHLSGVGDVEAWETSEDAQALTCCRAILALGRSPVRICCYGKVLRISCNTGSCVFRFFADSEAASSLLTEANQYFEHRRPTREEFHLPVSAKGGISFNDDAIRLLLDAVEVDRCLDFVKLGKVPTFGDNHPLIKSMRSGLAFAAMPRQEWEMRTAKIGAELKEEDAVKVTNVLVDSRVANTSSMTYEESTRTDDVIHATQATETIPFEELSSERILATTLLVNSVYGAFLRKGKRNTLIAAVEELRKIEAPMGSHDLVYNYLDSLLKVLGSHARHRTQIGKLLRIVSGADEIFEPGVVGVVGRGAIAAGDALKKNHANLYKPLEAEIDVDFLLENAAEQDLPIPLPQGYVKARDILRFLQETDDLDAERMYAIGKREGDYDLCSPYFFPHILKRRILTPKKKQLAFWQYDQSLALDIVDSSERLTSDRERQTSALHVGYATMSQMDDFLKNRLGVKIALTYEIREGRVVDRLKEPDWVIWTVDREQRGPGVVRGSTATLADDDVVCLHVLC
eukprot:scaffold2363_cov159-Pinguiococcus_pyrenoidosus.AAC.3